MLGEVALVPKESPINQSGLMFFNTLFDENACCHVAAGAGFSEVLDGFMDMSEEEILAKGINDSLIHVDFMVGSDDLHIVGIHEDGSETDVFVIGTWAEYSSPHPFHHFAEHHRRNRTRRCRRKRRSDNCCWVYATVLTAVRNDVDEDEQQRTHI